MHQTKSSVLQYWKKTWENQLSFSCFALLRLIWKFRHKLDLRFSSMKICQTSSFSESSKSKAINWCIFEDSHQFLSKPRLLHNKNSQGLWPKQKIVLVSLALLRFYAKNVMRKLILWQVFSHMFFSELTWLNLSWKEALYCTYIPRSPRWRFIKRKLLNCKSEIIESEWFFGLGYLGGHS